MIGQVWIWLKNYIVLVYQLVRCFARGENLEKAELKTAASNRRIEIRPSMKQVLEEQQIQLTYLQSPYVFLYMEGRPILQDKLRELWMRAMKKSQLPYRRMHEVRHTFASWGLGAGDSPEWVARTLGHVNTSMVYKTYGRYISNLTRQDGSALEDLLGELKMKKATRIDTVTGTMAKIRVALRGGVH